MQAWRLGSYELVRRLGEGGMAQVYLARDIRLGREVAVKVLDQRLAERPGFRERFQREARVAAALDHPNIVPLYDFGESNSLLYLVMPFISGGSLQDLLRHAPLPVADVVTYGSQMSDALDYAHQRNVVHRDVKPANMLLHGDGRLMLSDFGLAKILSSTSRPVVPRGHPDAGTPEYMAPEQIEGRTDERSDIYALGVVLYLLLTGQLPFTGMTSSVVMEGHLYRLPPEPRRLNPAVTPAMQAVVLRALAKHSDDRFQRAGELGAALLGALVAGDAEPLPFDASGGPPAMSLPPITPPAMRGTSGPAVAWNTPRLQSGQFPQVHPDMLALPPPVPVFPAGFPPGAAGGAGPRGVPSRDGARGAPGAPGVAGRPSWDDGNPRWAGPAAPAVPPLANHISMRPSFGPMVGPMMDSAAGPAMGTAMRATAGPAIQPSVHSAARSQSSGVYSPDAFGGMPGRMPILSQPVQAAPQPLPHPSLPYGGAYDAASAQPAYTAYTAYTAYSSQNPPVPQLGMHRSRERLAERNARRRLWLAVTLAVALAVVAVCVGLLVWLGQDPTRTLFVPGWRIAGALTAIMLPVVAGS